MSMSQSSTPEVSAFTRASPKPGVGSSRSEISSGAPNSVTTAARMVSAGAGLHRGHTPALDVVVVAGLKRHQRPGFTRLRLRADRDRDLRASCAATCWP